MAKIFIMPIRSCKVCRGSGMVDMGSVPYGSTWVSMGSDFCDCVVEQLPEDDRDFEIELTYADDLLAAWEAEAKADFEFWEKMEREDDSTCI